MLIVDTFMTSLTLRTLGALQISFDIVSVVNIADMLDIASIKFICIISDIANNVNNASIADIAGVATIQMGSNCPRHSALAQHSLPTSDVEQETNLWRT